MSEQRPSPAPAPALKKIDLTIARLRLLLADVTARGAALQEQRRTCTEQHNKLVTFSLYGDSSLDSVLAMLGDVQERLSHIEATSRALAAIRQRAENELQLRQAAAIDATDALSPAEIQADIARLRSLINEASERAARNIERTHRS